MIKPQAQVPELKVNLLNNTQWELGKQNPDNFTLVVFYRGLHCPVCEKYLQDLEGRLDDFSDLGVEVIAISMDTEQRATRTQREWGLDQLPVGCELDRDTAEKWGLFFSNAISDKEPEVFTEPGIFLIRPDNTLYASSVQSMPFARPRVDDLIKSIRFVDKEDYPARGVA